MLPDSMALASQSIFIHHFKHISFRVTSQGRYSKLNRILVW